MNTNNHFFFAGGGGGGTEDGKVGVGGSGSCLNFGPANPGLAGGFSLFPFSFENKKQFFEK